MRIATHQEAAAYLRETIAQFGYGVPDGPPAAWLVDAECELTDHEVTHEIARAARDLLYPSRKAERQ